MSATVIKNTGSALEATRERLQFTSMLMADLLQHLPVGRRSKRTKRYLVINLRLVTSEYERAIQELTEQLTELKEVQKAVTHGT